MSAPADLLEVTMAYGDRSYDPDRRLLWNPPGSFAPLVPDRSVHLVPQSAWYALGLLRRDGEGDLTRAHEVIDALLELQYDRPNTVWHGTFARVAEAPEPTGDAVEWVDYDPNWRQFVGTALLLALRCAEAALDPVLVARIDRALRLAVDGEPPDRVDAVYSNIALMRSVLEVEAGARFEDEGLVARGTDLAASVVARFDRYGAFDEYNSPTYYGIDLLGLAMWRTCTASSSLQAWGARLERELWEELALFFHRGLDNVIGPYSRTYGMDMARYVAAVSLWMWGALGRRAAPLPDPDAAGVDHGHDFLLGPVVDQLVGRVPPMARELLTAPLGGPRQVERTIDEDPRRVATAWLDLGWAFGAEEHDAGWHAAGQYAPATVHWQLPSGGVGTVRAFCDAPLSARAVDGTLTMVVPAPTADRPSTAPSSADERAAGAAPTPPLVFLVEHSGVEPAAFETARWRLPGLDLRVQSASTLASADHFGEHLLLTYEAPPGEGHRMVVRCRDEPGYG